MSEGVYRWNTRDDWSATQLLADGKSSVGWGNWPYEGEFQPFFISPGHPASFVFGHNTGKTPIYADTYSYTLYPDETLYVLQGEVYSQAGELMAQFHIPYFVKEAQGSAAAPSLLAVPTSSKVYVDGAAVSFDAYTTHDNNYCKLRDVANVLSGTNKQFEVTWDSSKKAINLISGKPFTPVGGEMGSSSGVTQSAQANTSAIQLDGKPVTLTAYTINGNNYFKLRDLGQLFDFNVSWDGANKAILVKTTAGYTED